MQLVPDRIGRDMPSVPRETAISVENAMKRYPGVDSPVLNGINLQVEANEFFTLLGPSGCGKTTLLRTIAGFENLTSGVLRLFGDRIDSLPANRRPVNTVFQHYALFPHMTVAENVAFGLRHLGRARAEIADAVTDVLQLVQLQNFANRRPAQMSGGQQQRVALARALAPHPRVLLLDEPLSALDQKLRVDMRSELKQIQKRTGITFLFVTHDQDEALAMSDRIAVMSNGRVEQVGTPDEIYSEPANRFVASFIGETNLLPIKTMSTQGSQVRVDAGGGLEFEATLARRLPEAGNRLAMIRPENLILTAEAQPGSFAAAVENLAYLGSEALVTVSCCGKSLVLRVSNGPNHRPLPAVGAHCHLLIPPGAARIIPAETVP